MSFGEHLRALREAKGLTVTQLADRSQIGKTTLWDYERGKHDNPRMDTLVILAEVLGVTLDELAGRNDGD